MSDTPRFSIVMPTRNRADLLRWALRSALEQDFGDFEVVVSDNCSEDGTRDVVAASGDRRVRLIRPDGTLPMPRHWEFAIAHARGDRVLFLCDDDAFLPDTLSVLARRFEDEPRLDCIVYGLGTYNHPQSPPGYEPNVLYLPGERGGVEAPDRDGILRRIAAGGLSDLPPKMLNCAISRGALDALRAKAGRLFAPNSPDYSFAALSILGGIEWVRLREVLCIWGRSARSIGTMSAYKKNDALTTFLREFGSEDPLAFVPVRVNLNGAYVASSVRAAAKDLGIDLEIDRFELYRTLFGNLETREHWVGFVPERRQLLDALAREPEDLRRRVLESAGMTGGIGPRIRSWLRRSICTFPALTALERKLRGVEFTGAPEGTLRIRGSDGGFSNIFEAARAARGILRKEAAPALGA